MQTKVACPHCGRVLGRHCASSTCDWFTCHFCSTIFGPRNLILFGEAKERAEEVRRRLNGS